MASTIKLKNGSGAPLAGDLVQGEPALDLTNKRLYTEDSGGTVIEVGVNPAAEITANGGIALPDSQKATFGASDDLQIFHNGTESFIREVGTGGLKIDTNGPDISLRVNATESAIIANSNGSVDLYYDNSQKLATTSTGVDVTGTVTADALTVDGDTEISSVAPTIYMMETDVTNESWRIRNQGSSFYIGRVNDAKSNTGYSAKFDQNGDVSLFEDTGTTAKFYWDASAESLGIGTDTPQEPLHVAGNIRFGDTAPAEIYTNSSELRIGVDRNDDNGASDITFYTNNSEKARIDADGNLLVGKIASDTDTAGAELNSDGLLVATRDGATAATLTRKSSNGTIVIFRKDTTTVGTIQVTASATSYNTSSDYRLKEDIQPMVGALDRLMALKPVNFAWKADGSRVDGFIAHEAQEVVPESVTGTKDGMTTEEYEVSPAVYEDVIIPAVTEERLVSEAILDENGNELEPAVYETVEVSPERTEKKLVSEAVMGTREVPDYQGIDQSKLVPLLTKALQEALLRIEALEAQVGA